VLGGARLGIAQSATLLEGASSPIVAAALNVKQLTRVPSPPRCEDQLAPQSKSAAPGFNEVRSSTRALGFDPGRFFIPERRTPMRVLRCARAIDEEITAQPDRFVAHLLARHTSFMGEYEGNEILTVILVEPGDTAAAVDSELHGQLLANAYSDKQFGDPGFIPPFETLTEHQSFYEVFFIEGGGERGISVVCRINSLAQ
jgi:hypothetical protein